MDQRKERVEKSLPLFNANDNSMTMRLILFPIAQINHLVSE